MDAVPGGNVMEDGRATSLEKLILPLAMRRVLVR